MKKIILIFIIFSLSAAALFADSTFKLKELKFKSMNLGMGNDRWSNGFSRNMDDQKTYSLSFALDYNMFFINIDVDAMTAKDFSSRYDLMTFTYGMPAEITDYSSWVFKLGVSFYGNLFLETAQNLLHKAMNIYTLSEQYPKTNRVFSLIGVYGDVHLRLGKFNFALYMDLDIKPIFSADEEFGARVDLDTFSFFVGYRYMQKFYNDLTLEFWVNRRKGYQVGYIVDKGTVGLNYFINPLTHQGYGEFKIKLFADYKSGAFKYSLGKMWYYMSIDRETRGLEHFNTLEIKLAFLYLSTHFNTGDKFNRPMDNGIFSAGLAISLPYGFVVKPNAKYSRFMYHRDWVKDCHVGFGCELMWGGVIFDYYKINLILALTWLINRTLSPSFGFNIELV